MSIFSSRHSRKNKRPSPLMQRVETIDSKIDDVLAILSTPRPGGQQQQQEQSTPQHHDQGFEPFEPFSETEQEGASGNGV